VVTEDSVSMIFEALSAGCKVVTIPVSFLQENKFVRCLRDLQERHLVTNEISESGEEVRLTLNEAERCVNHMSQQSWWPLS